MFLSKNNLILIVRKILFDVDFFLCAKILENIVKKVFYSKIN